MSICIELKDISKKFQIGYTDHQKGIAKLLAKVSGQLPKKEIEILKNVSFTVNKGEIIGIIGKNGTGKSTLLSIVAQIYQYDSGSCDINGKVVPVLGLGHGLRDRLTMHDNIYLCCALFGLSRKTIAKRLNSIVAFTGLEKFLHTKLFQFSDGMKARIVFSMALHCDPEILLLDEVTSNLDKDFIQMVINTVLQKSKEGITSLIVSHDSNVIKICDRVIWIKDHTIQTSNSPSAIMDEYSKS